MAAEGEEDLRWKTRSYNFTQETSFHGIAYVPRATRFKLRKFIWFLIVIGVSTGFLTLVSHRIIYYLSWPKAVNFKVVYPDSLEFPAVTICNQNRHRATEVHHRDLFDEIAHSRDFGTVQRSAQAKCVDTFQTRLKNTLVSPKIKDLILREYVGITGEVCRHICLELEPDCNSVIFHRGSEKCSISPYSHTFPGADLKPDPGSDYYQRIRCEGEPSLNCDFDAGNTCWLNQDENDDFEWEVQKNGSRVRGTGPNGDHTTRRGSYLMVAGEDTGSKARIMTPTIPSTSKRCVEFYYFMHGRDVGALRVQLRDSAGRLNLLWESKGNQGQRWHRGYAGVIPGIYQFIFEAEMVAGSRNVIALDDITVAKCGLFVRNCRKTVIGDNYMGKQSTTTSGKTCQRWDTQTPHTHTFTNNFIFPDKTIKEAENYCRNPDGRPGGPWCYTTDPSMPCEHCNISMCECLPYQMRCKSNECVDNTLQCDGNKDCEDGSDELPQLCNATLDCDFSSKYMCGYSVPEDTQYTWARAKGRTPSLNTGPDFDHTSLSPDGYYMYTESSLGNAGDISRLKSSQVTIKKTSCLSFWYHMYGKHLGELSVHLLLKGNIDVQIFKLSKNRYNHWRIAAMNVQMRTDPFYFVFQSKRGLGFKGDIAIDDVTLKEGKCDLPDCKPDEIQCNNGRCIKKTLKCNGKDNCLDSSDEGASCGQQYCTLHPSMCVKSGRKKRFVKRATNTGVKEPNAINCKFDDANICGYKVTSQYKQLNSWTRISQMGDQRYPNHFLASQNKEVGYMMVRGKAFIYNREAKTTLQSSYQNHDAGTYCLSFFYFVNSNSSNPVHVRAISLKDSKKSYLVLYELYGDETTRWTRALLEVKLPKDAQFAVSFGSDLGVPSGGIAIDDVLFQKKACKDIAACPATPVADEYKVRVGEPKQQSDASACTGAGKCWDATACTGRSCIRCYQPPESDVFRSCLKDELRCKNGRCVPKKNICNGIDDCLDFTDEKQNCGPCKSYQHRCPDGLCIGIGLLCDGNIDCSDGSDEFCDSSSQTKCSGKTPPRLFAYEKPSGVDNSTNTKRPEERIVQWGTNRNGGFKEVDDFFRSSAHKVSDLIHGCWFDGGRCASTNFTTINTDFGVCYSFNSDPNNIYSVKRVGNKFGLQLIINVEDYEYMMGAHVYSGLKIFLHNQDEIPLVRDLGIAIPPGLHTLVSIKKISGTSLRKPIGDCDSIDLPYFKGKTYTLFRCQQNCEIKEIVKKCKCRGLYMPELSPGIPRLCSVREYFKCVVPFLEEITLSDCECPEPCSRTSYEASLSSAKISTRNGDEASRQSSNIQRKYLKARDTQDHVTKDTYVSDLKVVTAISINYRKLHKYVKHSLKARSTKAIFRKVQNALYHFSKNLIQDRKNRIMKRLPDLIGAFEERFLIKRNNLWHSVDSTIGYILLFEQYRLKKINYMPKITEASELLSLSIDQLKAYDKSITTIIKDKDLPDKLSTLYKCVGSTSTCLSCVEEIVKEFQTIADKLKGKTFDVKYTQTVDALKSKRHSAQTCLDAYYNLLLTLQKDVSSPDNTAYDRLGSTVAIARHAVDVDELYAPAQETQLRVDELIRDYRAFKINKRRMASFFTKETYQSAIEAIDNYVNVIASLTNGIRTDLQMALPGIKTLYTEMYWNALKIQNLFSNEIALFSDVFLFRRPIVQFGPRGNVFEYTSEYEGSWKNIKLINFWYIVDEHIEAYFEPILNQIDVFNERLHNISGELKIAMKEANQLMGQYLEEDQVGQEFLTRNFLTLDVYYSQLSYQNIEQVRTYDEGSLASEIGGNMGLFIGASIVTLFEVLDFIFYTIALRQAAKVDKGKKKKPPKPLENHAPAKKQDVPTPRFDDPLGKFDPQQPNDILPTRISIRNNNYS